MTRPTGVSGMTLDRGARVRRTVLYPGAGGAVAAGVVLAVVTGSPVPYLVGGLLTAALLGVACWVYLRSPRA